MVNISEGCSIKIPPACSVNIVNSLMSLLMEKISRAYISVKVSQLWSMMNYSVNDKSFQNRAWKISVIRPHTRAMMILLTSARVCVCVRVLD